MIVTTEPEQLTAAAWLLPTPISIVSVVPLHVTTSVTVSPVPADGEVLAEVPAVAVTTPLSRMSAVIDDPAVMAWWRTTAVTRYRPATVGMYWLAPLAWAFRVSQSSVFHGIAAPLATVDDVVRRSRATQVPGSTDGRAASTPSMRCSSASTASARFWVPAAMFGGSLSSR